VTEESRVEPNPARNASDTNLNGTLSGMYFCPKNRFVRYRKSSNTNFNGTPSRKHFCDRNNRQILVSTEPLLESITVKKKKTVVGKIMLSPIPNIVRLKRLFHTEPHWNPF